MNTVPIYWPWNGYWYFVDQGEIWNEALSATWSKIKHTHKACNREIHTTLHNTTLPCFSHC